MRWRTRERDRPFLAEYPTLELLRQDGGRVGVSEALQDKRFVLVYFATHGVPSCQRFTPFLADFFDHHGKQHHFTVLFVSLDRDETIMMDFFQNRRSNYVRRPAAGAVQNNNTLSGLTLRQARPPPRANGHGNWYALPFVERRLVHELQRRYKVLGVPALLVIDTATSRLVTRRGHEMVMRDAQASNFPWTERVAVTASCSSVTECTILGVIVCLVAALLLFAAYTHTHTHTHIHTHPLHSLTHRHASA